MGCFQRNEPRQKSMIQGQDDRQLAMGRLTLLPKTSHGASFGRLYLCITLFSLLFVTTPALAQTARQSSHVKDFGTNATSFEALQTESKFDVRALAIRGGLVSILFFPLNLVKSYVDDQTVGSFIKTHTILIAKGAVILFVTASVMAYLGMIGDHDHHLQDWIEERENKFLAFVGKLGFHPRGYIRMRLQDMLNNFRNMPPRPKFASAVSLGTTAFPLMARTFSWTVRILLGGFLFAEVLALLGVLGEPGEGLEKWVEEGGSEPLVSTIRRGIEDARVLLRQKLQVQEILGNFVDSLRKDDIYWLGFGVGALASMIIKEKYSE